MISSQDTPQDSSFLICVAVCRDEDRSHVSARFRIHVYIVVQLNACIIPLNTFVIEVHINNRHYFITKLQ